MAAFVIPAERIDLVLQTPEELLAWVETLPPADRAEVSSDWIARVQSTQPGDIWALGFLVVERSSQATIGGCMFKGPPDANGGVEVAYGIDESHQNQGYATEATRALTNFAFTSGKVKVVQAHTKSDTGASAGVLTKCGFTNIGQVIDPEDDLVHRWEKGASSIEANQRDM